MGVLGWILFGLIVGVIAKLLTPGRDPGGFIVTTLLGIVGAVIGGFVGRSLGLYGPGEAAGFLMATLGAVVLLLAYRMLSRPARISTAPERQARTLKTRTRKRALYE